MSCVSLCQCLTVCVKAYKSDKSSPDLKTKSARALKLVIQKCTKLDALDPLLKVIACVCVFVRLCLTHALCCQLQTAPDKILRYVVRQFAKVLPNNPGAKKAFLVTRPRACVGTEERLQGKRVCCCVCDCRVSRTRSCRATLHRSPPCTRPTSSRTTAPTSRTTPSSASTSSKAESAQAKPKCPSRHLRPPPLHHRLQPPLELSALRLHTHQRQQRKQSRDL